MKLFIVHHLHQYGDDLSVVASEAEFDIIDMCIADPDKYEPWFDEGIYVEEIPSVIYKHLDHDALAAELKHGSFDSPGVTIIPLASSEERQRWLDKIEKIHSLEWMDNYPPVRSD